jgi:cob(I)alamin adenosyltransferase
VLSDTELAVTTVATGCIFKSELVAVAVTIEVVTAVIVSGRVNVVESFTLDGRDVPCAAVDPANTMTRRRETTLERKNVPEMSSWSWLSEPLR